MSCAVAEQTAFETTASKAGADVVRVGYSIRSSHADLLNSILVAVRRTTGDACTASHLIRLAIEEFAKQPLEQVLLLLDKSSQNEKMGRRRKPK